MIRRATLLSLTLVVAWSPGVFQPAESVVAGAAAGLCLGQLPTIVGAPNGAVIQGTEGPDVVVTNGASGADTFGGDDLLCITGVAVPNPFDPHGPIFHTGRGDDRILGGSDSPEIYSGSGSDWVQGGAGNEFVRAGDRLKGDTDVVVTGGGSDVVEAGLHDVVALGRGSDALYVRFVPGSSGGDYNGGPGRDSLGLDLKTPEHHPFWEIDNRAGRLTRNREVLARMRGFSMFGVKVRGPLAFIGSDRSEQFLSYETSFYDAVPRWPLDVRLRGGDDEVGFTGGAPGSRFDGGRGNDSLGFRSGTIAYSSLTFDLSTGLLRDTPETSGTPETRRAVNFENGVVGVDGPVTINGTSGPNLLRSEAGFDTSSATINGRGGDDVLVGRYGNDVLVGGPGRDSARGGRGIDRCEAEVRKGCEL